ncbi:citrate transporter [Pseudomonas gingeri NCPPB 3146 = LMG 5327]|uniref:Citrate transporter n=2 Tax=Pseudomonas gingeri TaxID=117681 RepID=A0A7Y8CC63_9PSED|nr:citrate:proton symporter [Pseudomonas gingeri]NWC13348.1 citrate transporter [Pseudomonas gingeri]PNQ92346.1 citrate transporter [Pseudomonas gingeri NCPPB 3146 = LMG 5327]
MALVGFGMVITFMYLIMSKRLSAIVALILVPVLFAVASGFGSTAGTMVLDGIRQLAPTAMMLMFAILFFAIMYDAGLFEPLIRRVVASVGNDPLRVTVGTALLSSAISLDGDGSTTVLVVVTALLPIYLRLGMNPLIIAVLLLLTNSPINLVPWGGPTARAASALHLDAMVLFVGLIPVILGCLVFAFVVACWLGMRERKRLNWQGSAVPSSIDNTSDSAVDSHRPGLIWVNLALTLALVAAMGLRLGPLPVLMMVAFALALLINYPKLEDQKRRIAAHADSVLSVLALIFAAGAFTGILTGTGMVDAMSNRFIAVLPDSAGPHLAIITAFASLPFTFFMSNDAFFFGIVPLLAKAAAQYGIDPMHVARAAVLGQPVHALSPLLAAGYLMSGLLNREVGELQRFCLKWSVLSALVAIGVALLCGAII